MDNHELPTVETFDERSEDTTIVELDNLATLMAGVLNREGVGGTGEASLTLVDPARIAELKAEHLDGDGSPTDVLSFPIDGIEGDPDETGVILVGDIVVCPSVAQNQAGEHAGSTQDELALLVIHGSLHLTGWDHAEPEEQAKMWSREKELMIELHGEPVRDPWGSDGDGSGSAPATDDGERS